MGGADVGDCCVCDRLRLDPFRPCGGEQTVGSGDTVATLSVRGMRVAIVPRTPQ